MVTIMKIVLLVLFVMGLSSLPNVQAHESRPAVLNINEQKPGWFEVTWKIPILAEDQVEIRPVFPESMAAYGPPAIHDVPGARIEYSTYQAEGNALSGETITIDGLSTTQIDVMVRINLADGTS